MSASVILVSIVACMSLLSIAISVLSLFACVRSIACCLGSCLSYLSLGFNMALGGSGASPVLSPSRVPSIAMMRPGDQCVGMDLDELWAWLAGSQRDGYRTEFRSDDPVVRGVALSRFAQSYENMCNELCDNNKWRLLLQPSVYEEITKEARGLLPHLRVLNGCEVPLPNKRRRVGDADQCNYRDEGEVAAAAASLLAWLRNSNKSRLRVAIDVVSAGGLSHNACIDQLVVMAYCKYGNGESQLVGDAVARLCRGPSVDR